MTLQTSFVAPAPLPRSASPTEWHQFWQAVFGPQPEDALLQLNANGVLDALLPEWQRLRGPLNTQHATHDFPLDRHSIQVIAGTVQSSYFRRLTPHQQRLTVIAAVFHDIAKAGGRPASKLTRQADFFHPTKGVAVVWRRAAQWGLTLPDVARVARLVRHHQRFGRLIMRFPDPQDWPTPQDFYQVALWLQSTDTLAMLLALTEGDIAAVKQQRALFNPQVADKLAQYAVSVHQALETLASTLRSRWTSASLNPSLQPANDVPLWIEGTGHPTCACGWPLSEDGQLFWASRTPLPQGLRVVCPADQWLSPATVLPAHWPNNRISGYRLQQLVAGWQHPQTPMELGWLDWWQQPVVAPGNWVLLMNPIQQEPLATPAGGRYTVSPNPA